MLTKPMPLNITQAFTSDYKRSPLLLIEGVGLSAILMFSLIFWINRDLGRICEVTATVAVVLSAWQIWRRDRVEWLWLLLAGWILFMAFVNFGATIKYPEFEGDHIRYARYYTRLFLFLIAGWWLGGNLKTVFIFLGLAALGIFTEGFLNAGAKEWEYLFAGKRVDFAFRNAQHTAITFSIVFIGALCFWKRFFVTKFKMFRFLTVIVWTVLAAASFLILIGTQTRQLYPAFFACIIAAAIWSILKIRSRNLNFRQLALPSITLCTIIIVALLFFEPIQGTWQRFEKDRETILQGIQGDIDNLEQNGVGIRIRQWRFAADKFLEKPLTGYGGATKYLLIKNSDMPDYIKARFGHFHNGYLEMGVAYGLPGLLMVPLLLSVLAARLVRARRKGNVPEDFMLFGLLSLIFFAVVNLFESYVMYRSGYFLMCVVGGTIYTLTRPWNFKSKRKC